MLSTLSTKAALTLHRVFRPKTRTAYKNMFKTFVAFCVYTKVLLLQVNVKVILSFLACLVTNKCSNVLIANYVSAIKAQFILYDLLFTVLQHPKIRYFLKALRIDRPLSVKPHNIITLPILSAMSKVCTTLPHGEVFRATLLLGFFGFLRLSNLAPHSIAAFDHNRHLTGEDVFFTKRFLKIIIKWSKTIQTRDTIQCLTLPKLTKEIIYPYSAVNKRLYPMSATTSLFQTPVAGGYIPFTDSRVRKMLKRVNMQMGLNSHFYTFHDLRRSGAMFAYNCHIPIQDIKRHGMWSSDCVWQYIQSNHESGEHLARSFATNINVS